MAIKAAHRSLSIAIKSRQVRLDVGYLPRTLHLRGHILAMNNTFRIMMITTMVYALQAFQTGKALMHDA